MLVHVLAKDEGPVVGHAENRADMGEVIEAYPMTNLPRKRQTVGEAFMGFSTTFERLGFEQVSERSRVRNIWRLHP